MANDKEPTTQQPGQDVAMYKARLPYHSRFEQEYGITKGSWRTLVEAIWPAAKSVEAVQMALAYCKARNLDPFKRPVHIVPVYSSVLKGMVETVWPGISELRTTATRTKAYAGMLACEFGPTITKAFKNEDGKEIEVEFPEWARVTVRKLVGGAVMDFPGPMVRWMETYATESRKSDWPNAMWRKRPFGQIEKCAEAATLRRAFPEEIGNDYTVEEMEGQTIHGGGIIVEHEETGMEAKGPPKGPPPVKGAALAVEHKPEVQMDTKPQREPEMVEREPEPPEEEEQAQAEEVPEEERKTEPAKKQKAAADKKPPAAAAKKGGEPDNSDEEFDLLIKSLKVAMKQARAEESDKPVYDWITATKEERKALGEKNSRIGTHFRQILAVAYEDPQAGPEALTKVLVNKGE
jgi:phage recombination protein Bet